MVSELFIENVTDERAEISRDFVYDTNRVTYMRPMTIGLKSQSEILISVSAENWDQNE